MKYRIKVNEEQAGLIQNALEVVSRLQSSQFDIAFDLAIPKRIFSQDIDLEEYREKLKELKSILFPELSPTASYGVGNNDEGNISQLWSMVEVIRHRLAWDRLEGEEPELFSGQYEKPMNWHGGEMPTIEEIKVCSCDGEYDIKTPIGLQCNKCFKVDIKK